MAAGSRSKTTTEGDITPPAEEKLDFDDDTLRAIVEVYKDEGNNEYHEKDFRNAIHFYTEGIKVRCKDNELNAKLYSNRATAYFYEGNFQESLDDARAAVDLQPTYMKALARGASACVELGLYDDAITWCDKGLAVNKKNSTLLNLKKRSTDELQKKKQERDKKEPTSKIANNQGEMRSWATVKRTNGNACENLADALQIKEFFEKGTQLMEDYAATQGDVNHPQWIGLLERATRFIELHLQIQKGMGDGDGGAVYGFLGDAYSLLGNLPKAIDYHERYLKMAKDTGNRSAEGNMYHKLGHVYYRLGDFKAAVQYYDLHLKFAKGKGDRVEECRANFYLGKTYHALRDFERAIHHQEMSLEIAKETGNRIGEGQAYGSLGNCHLSLASFKRALHYHELYLEISKELGDRGGEGNAYGGIGNGHAGLGDLKKAIHYYELALNVYREVGDRNREGQVYGNLAQGHEGLGEIKKSLYYQELSLDIAKEVRNRDAEGSAYGNLAALYGLLGEFNKATDYHELHLSIAKERKDRDQEGRAYAYLGSHYQRLGDIKMAIFYHELQLEIAKEESNKTAENNAYGSLGIDYCKHGDFKKAIYYCQLNLRISKEVGDRAEEGRGYCSLGNCYSQLRDFKTALHYHEAALKIAKAVSDKFGENKAYYSLGNDYLKLGDFKTAIHYHTIGLTIAQEIGDIVGVASLYGILGNDYYHLGDFKKAIHYYELNLGIFKQLGDRRREGDAYCNLGNTFLSTGELKKAVYYHELHLETTRELGDRAKEGARDAYANLGNTYHQLGDFKKAIFYHERYLDIVKESGDKLLEGRAYCNLGADYSMLGYLQKATHYHELQLKIARQVGDRDGEARAYCNLGNEYRSLGNLKKAKKYYQLRLEIAKTAGDRVSEGISYSNLGIAHFELRDFEEAISYSELGLKFAKEIGQRDIEGKLHTQLGRCYDALGYFEKANWYHKVGLEIAKEVGNAMNEGSAYNGLGYSFELRGYLQDALTCYRSSVKVLSDVRARLQFKDEWKINLRQKFHGVYTNLWSVLLKQNKGLEAVEAAEQGRAEALKDLMEYKYGLQTSRDALDSWKETLSCLPSNTVFITVENREGIIRIHFWVFEKGKDVIFRTKVVSDSQSIDVTTFFRSLMGNTYEKIGVKEDMRCEDRSLNNLVDEEVLAGDRSDQTKFHSSNFESSILTKWFDLVIEPIADLFDGNDLVIVPAGPLWLAPYAAFADSNGSFLCESFRIRLIPSLTSLKLIADSPEDYHCKSGALLVGDPWVQEIVTFTGTKLLQLPCAREEVQMIGRMLKTAPLTGRDATKNEVLKQLSSVALIHIAAHGRMETGEIALCPNPSRESQLPEEVDYLLKMNDVLTVTLRARLVVLSCCHSGRGDIKAEGVVGIARAFLGAGARSVLVSLWAIDDEATLEFMKNFYHHMMVGRRASEALNLAMKTMRESDEFNEIKHWAPFVLIGDDITLEFGDGK